MEEFSAGFDVKNAPTLDLERGYFNHKVWGWWALVRALLPGVVISIALFSTKIFFPLPESAPEWLDTMWKFGDIVAAFAISAGLVLFGGQAWKHLRIAYSLHKELTNRADRQSL